MGALLVGGLVARPVAVVGGVVVVGFFLFGRFHPGKLGRARLHGGGRAGLVVVAVAVAVAGVGVGVLLLPWWHREF